ncbi:DivIVA domain-containing protein [Amycolatopsis sp. NPDC059027]|uniref:DivIVA domain-containing protein n=1 Tax=unclassified Amycolatopsis TaxID=2618356 RepID=UPI00366FAF7D
MTPDEVRGVSFGKPPFGRRGYNEDEVDAFLDLVAQALAGRNTLTPWDVHNVEFSKPPLGMRAYHMRQVDAFLDDVEEELWRLRDAPPPSG